MPAPAGSESQFGYRFSKAIDTYGRSIWVPVPNKFFQFDTMSGLVATQPLVPVDNMDPSNQELVGTPGNATIAPKFSLNPDANVMMPLVAHMCDREPTITTPSGGVNARQWVVVPREYGDTANSTFISELVGEGSDNDGNPIFVDGMRLQDLGIKISRGKPIKVDLGFLACRDTYTSDATQLVGGTYSGKPIVIGHWLDSLSASTLKAKITVVAGSGFDGTVKWTTAAYAGSTVTQFKFDTWYRLTLDDASRLGIDRNEDVWFCFPSSSATAVALNQEWSFVSTRTLATPSFSTLTKLHAHGLELTVGGTLYYFHEADIKITHPLSANFVDGLKYALTAQKNGKRKASITLQRDRDDRDFLKKLKSAATVSAAVKMYGTPIEGAIDQLWQIDFPNMQVAKDQRDVTTENTLPETIELEAKRVGSTDIYTHTLVGTLTTL